MAFMRPWKSLSIEGDYPLLFLKAVFDGSRCHVQLTDLNRLWSGNLSRNELVRSANNQGTSIDPSEDDEQYEQFLSRVNSALEAERDTTVSLVPGEADDGLALSISARLPGSLPTFKWTLQLHRLDNKDSHAFEADILTPLLVHAIYMRSRIQYLVDELGHKDRVIAKIADKLESVGQDLSQVFPGASKSGWSKKISRVQLAKHVDGLAPFDAAAWQAESQKSTDVEDASVKAINTIFAELPEAGVLSAQHDSMGIWWRPRGQPIVNDDRGSDTSDSVAPRPSSRRLKSGDKMAGTPTPDSQKSDILNDSFQRQFTPPTINAVDDDETEEEDDLDAPSQNAGQSKARKETASNSFTKATPERSLGRVGGGKSTNSPPESGTATDERESTKQASRLLRVVGSKAAVDRGAYDTKTPTPEPEPTPGPDIGEPVSLPPAPANIARRTLGGYGGRFKRKIPDPEASVVSEIPETSTPRRTGRLGAFGGTSKGTTSPAETSQPWPSPTKSKPRLGAFGGRLQNDSQPTEAEIADLASQSLAGGTHIAGDNRDGRQPRKLENSEAEQQREDSEERANKRRDKLKAEIAERSKEPMKKKRKF